jgi:hypothetical protein
LVSAGEIEVGDLDFVMDVYIHRSIGGGDTDIVCLKRNYGKRCPICEVANEKNEKGDEAGYNALKASRRVYFNVLPIGKDDDDDEIKVFQMSHFYFLKPLTEEAEEGEGGNPIDYASQDDGKVISFRAVEESFKKNKFFKCESLKFEEREVDVTDKMIDQAVSFDEAMKVLSADEIEKILFGGDDDEDEDEDDKDSKRKKRDRDEEDDEEDQPKRKGKKDEDDDEEDDRKSKKRKSDDDDDSEGVDKKSKKSSERTDEEEKPKKKVKEEEEEKPKKSKECPEGFEFGKDVDKHKACEECKYWDDCDEAKFKSKKAK